MAVVAGRDVHELLAALGHELELRQESLTELVVIGGAALGVLGFVERPTKDIDVVALAESGTGVVRTFNARPLPAYLSAAVAEVAREMRVEEGWLNCGPAQLCDWGLPSGIEDRLVARDYGPSLRVHFAGRLDQICFKTYAAADVSGRHLTDLVALGPSVDDMDFAFRWVVTQDPSAGFRTQLESLADHLEVRDVLDGIPG
ncbi:MAG: DUF6036 family nucleotidyltransferase, partial [Coriobacteriia bacterium]|nr:DUF6036 family nucleotidyltransferase [Coriobacteriia bacterium]